MPPLVAVPDMSRLSKRDIEDVERSKSCQRNCPGTEECPFKCLLSILDTVRGRADIRLVRCAAFAAWEARERIERTIPSSRMLPRLKECTFTNFSTVEAPKSVILAKRSAFRAGQSGKTVVLAGDTGVGKTHLAAAIVHYVSTKGKSAILVSFAALLNDLRNSFSLSAGKEISASQIFEVLRSADCLALDDVGQEARTDYADSCLYQIVNDRYNARSQLIVTTNYPTYETFMATSPRGPYIVRRLREMGCWIRIEAEAYRGRERG
jgi:DNA replication protein DnaC